MQYTSIVYSAGTKHYFELYKQPSVFRWHFEVTYISNAGRNLTSNKHFIIINPHVYGTVHICQDLS
jgi:hypothetical protein